MKIPTSKVEREKVLELISGAILKGDAYYLFVQGEDGKIGSLGGSQEDIVRLVGSVCAQSDEMMDTLIEIFRLVVTFQVHQHHGKPGLDKFNKTMSELFTPEMVMKKAKSVLDFDKKGEA